MKSFIVKIPVSQEGLGPLLAKIANDGSHYDIEAVDDVPYWRNGSKAKRAKNGAGKAPKAKGLTKDQGRGKVAEAAIEALPSLPQPFKAADMMAELNKVGLAPKNIHSVIANVIRKGFAEKMAEGRYKKVSQ